MEQIRHNETWPVIDREKLLRDSQDRELNRLFWVLESDQFSVFDVEDTLIQLWQNNPKARPYIAQFVNSQNSSLESILMRNANNETRENPETTKRLNLYKNLTKDLQKSLQDIQKSLNDSTSLSLRAMDNIAWLFTDDTIFNTYNSSFESIKNQAKNILWRIQEIDINSLTTNQKEVYNKTISELNQILSLKLETTWFIQMAWNEIDQIPQNLNYTAHAIKWEVIWLYEWGKAIITWSIDLLTFMIKYPFNSKYRQEINKQAEIIYDFVKAELIEQKIQEARQMKWETPEEQQILERYIETLNKEKESLQRIDNLYNNPRYKFLEKYKEVLGENISVSDVVWEWTQAIIMKHPTNDRLVLKIAKPWEVDDIMQEFKNHNLFYEKWLELSYDWKIDKNIKVPQVLKWEVDWYFYMEKVDWQSLYSKTLIERYEKQLSPEELKTIWELDDKQVREFLKKRFKETDSYLD